MFRNGKGEQFQMTQGQCEIFEAIYTKKYPRVHISCHTRYGKSDVISMAVLLSAATFPEKWAIVAGNKEKASIIMQYIISHLFDNAYTKQKFIIGKGENEEDIKRYRNKDRINFNLGDGKLGEIFITTAEGALGFGAPNIIEDEAALISSQDHALVMRMLGDQPDNFLCKVGNPWEQEHFRKSSEDANYHKIIIDYGQGIREGRITPAYIDEMRKQPFFDVLYECKFPASGLQDDKGWISLLTREEIERAMIEPPINGFGINKLGVDVAGGGRNYSVIVQRHTNVAKIIHKTKESDTMCLAEKVIGMSRIFGQKYKFNIHPSNIFVDMVGIGRGCYDLLNREIPGVWGINGGSEPTSIYEKEKYTNLRAELFWRTREWILKGGKLERNEDWFQLCQVKYRVKLEGTRGKLQIISKEELAGDGVLSPDVADALSMTFRTDDMVEVDREEVEEQERHQMGGFDPNDPFALQV